MWSDLKEKCADSAAPSFRDKRKQAHGVFCWCPLPQGPTFLVVGVACARLQPLQTHRLSPPPATRARVEGTDCILSKTRACWQVYAVWIWGFLHLNHIWVLGNTSLNNIATSLYEVSIVGPIKSALHSMGTAQRQFMTPGSRGMLWEIKYYVEMAF